MVVALARVLLVLAVAYGAWRAPETIRAMHDDGTARAAMTETDRVEAAARSVDIDMRLLREAERVIPPDATFAPVTGELANVSHPVTLSAFPDYAAYWLLPRRRVQDPRRAEWIVSYGADVDALGLRYERVIDVGDGLKIAKVRG